jgi:hypothetical protein
MCIEIYSTSQPISIPFEHESIRFKGPTSYSATFSILLRNDGDAPIDRLSVLYRRRLFSDPTSGTVALQDVADVSDHLSQWPESTRDADRLSLVVPHPLAPSKDLALNGFFRPDDVAFTVPNGFSARHTQVLNSFGFTAWQAEFKTPLQPGEAQWLAWRVGVRNVQAPIVQTPIGNIVYHTFASPKFVHSTIAESFKAAADSVEQRDLDYYESVLKMFGLRGPRRVDIGYRILNVQPGSPSDLTLLSWSTEGKLQLRTAHATAATGPRASEQSEDVRPTFEWRSGSIISGDSSDDAQDTKLHCTFLVGPQFTEPAQQDIYISSGSDPPSRPAILKPSESPEKFDVFLCHNSRDKPDVKQIGRQLMEQGIRPWLDEWDLRPGFSWQKALEEQISNIRAAAVFVGKSGIGPWQDQELSAFLREFVKRDCPVIPVILSSCESTPELPVFLSGMTWVDFRQDEPVPLDRLIWGVTGRRPKPQ